VNSDFVEEVLKKAIRQRECQYQLEAEGYGIDQIGQRAANFLNIKSEQIWERGKYNRAFKARSLFCYWAVRELGVNVAELARRIEITQQSSSQMVKRGEDIPGENGLKLNSSFETYNLMGVPLAPI
jgi:hypothetical protein